MKLRLCALYPEQMNIYADRGNIMLLRRRCEWRGIGFEYAAAGPGETFDPAEHDFLYMGGGQDRDQRIVATDLVRTKGGAMADAVDDGAVLLAVCGGYQLLGHSYQLGDERIEGLGLADLETVREPGPRLIGNVEIEVDLNGPPRRLAGFENHGGRTHLGPQARPLARVAAGIGNDGTTEGAWHGSVLGTYSHGPALSRNPQLADLLLRWATGSEALDPLDDTWPDRLRGERLQAVT
jgi:hypothetical protein